MRTIASPGRRSIAVAGGRLFARWSLIVLSLTGAPAYSAESPTDIIYGTQGNITRGKIKEITRADVSLEIRGETTKLPVSDIDRIVFAGEPSTMRRGRESIAQQQWQSAKEHLERATAEAKEQPFIQQEIEYLKAYCACQLALAGEADVAAAIEQLSAFVRRHRNTWHFFSAAETLGDLEASREKYPEAVKYYRQLHKAPAPATKHRGIIREAELTRWQGKYPEALRLWESLPADQIPPAALRQITIGRAVCLAELGRAAEGLKLVETLIGEADPEDEAIMGPAYNAMGDCYRQLGQTEDALLAYLHVDVLYAANGPAHAESLSRLKPLWKELSREEEARKADVVLRERYKGSRWSKP